MVRKGDSSNANDIQRNASVSSGKRLLDYQSKGFPYKASEYGNRNYHHSSLSRLRIEKGYGAGNIKTGRSPLALPAIYGGVIMNKLFYPAVFHKAEEGGYWISFPDFPECFTEGDDMQSAYEMAVDALGLAITSRESEKEPLPPASQPFQLCCDSDSFSVIVEFDMLSYKKRTNPRAVKKTLSIPEWLNEEAVSLGVNFSQVLQEALIAKIQAK